MTPFELTAEEAAAILADQYHVDANYDDPSRPHGQTPGSSRFNDCPEGCLALMEPLIEGLYERGFRLTAPEGMYVR